MEAEIKNEQLLASEAREKLLAVWKKLEFGVKERVKKIHSQRTVHYILSTDTYSKTEVILDILETIKLQSDELKRDVIAMDDEIQKSLG